LKIKLVGSVGEPQLSQFATSFLIDDELAVDAGTLGFALPLPQQARIRDILVTHAHLDHVCSLPIMIDNVFDAEREPLRVHAHPETAKVLREHLFNDRIWPDLIRIGESDDVQPMLEFRPFEKERPFWVGGIQVTAIAVPHTVRCFSFLLEKDGAAALVVGDTGPTRRIWEIAAKTPGLSHVFVEASFPDEQADLAKLTKHLTPSTLQAEKAKVPGDVTFVAYHLKPRYAARVGEELEALGDPQIVVARSNEEYRIT
jgi:cAMP phosphodiesterase